MTDLPPGWVWTTLGEISTSVTNGIFVSRASAEPDGVPILRISAVRSGILDLTDLRYSRLNVEDLARRDALVQRGDLLFTRYSGSPEFVGVCAAAPDIGELTFPDKLIRARISTQVDPIYVELAIRSPQVRTEVEARHRTTAGQVGISGSALKTVPLPLPPLAEQLRIVGETERHLATTDQAAHTVGSVRERSKTLGEASVRKTLYPPTASPHAPPPTASFTGDGDLPSIPKEWSWQRLGDVAEVVGGVTKDSSKQSDPTVPLVPYLRVANVQRGRLELSEVAHIRATQRQVDKLALRPGDILLNEGGDRDKLGRGWVWEGQIKDCIHQNHVFRARVRDGVIHPKLLAWHANNFGHWFERNGKQSVNLASISLTTIKQLPVPVPPRELQQEMVARIESTLATCGRLQSAATDAIARAGALRASILRAACMGELTRQDPSDEPAAALLERIRAERDAAASTTPARRRPSRSPTR